jgi:hypothetical protein
LYGPRFSLLPPSIVVLRVLLSCFQPIYVF